MCLGGQGPPLGQQRASGKALAKTECLCRPGAHLGGLSGLEGCGAGSVALAEGPCLYCRMTPASAGCVPLAVQVAGWPLAQAAGGPRRQGSTQPRELLPQEEVVASRMAGEPSGWAGPRRSSTDGPHRPQRQSWVHRMWGPQKEQLWPPRVACSPVAGRGKGEERCYGQRVGPFGPLEQE